MNTLTGFTELELMIGNMYGEARLIEGDLSDDIREYLAIGCVVMNRANSTGFWIPGSIWRRKPRRTSGKSSTRGRR